jgi:hypothetical protein
MGSRPGDYTGLFANLTFLSEILSSTTFLRLLFDVEPDPQ